MAKIATQKKASKKNTTRQASLTSISSQERLEQMLAEAEKELELLEPKIIKLEKQIAELQELKLTKQKLITLKLSVKSILSNFDKSKNSDITTDVINYGKSKVFVDTKVKYETNTSLDTSELNTGKTFLPDVAFEQVDQILRKKTSINYDLFRAVVYNGGRASTEQIKEYLLENDIKQPANGESFKEVELTDISSRVNYLVRKGIVQPDGRGRFTSCLGWADEG